MLSGYGTGGSSYRNYPKLSTAPFASWEWGPAANDERHHVTVAGVVNLPKGFDIAPILQYGSARPYGVTNSANTLNTGGGTATAVVVPTSNPKAYLTFTTLNGYSSVSAADAAAENCFYGLGVAANCTIAKFNPLRGEPFFQLDTRLAKTFKFGDKANLQVIAEAFNLTNRANYGNNFGSAALGTTLANIASPLTFGHPQGFIAPSSTIIPRSTWGELGFRFSF